ncbi:dioxygenase family protein [Caldimonas manganoxidans]|jgi:protocatechuate 3,4-dioxygenase beta subunit|uniref:dioxygenase family protein n=1 Tax=Caldimonas manganoxidans TaxID=196015 RepID=UPI0003792462|nr:hypothetical protein [Caldimonas manganoxidans]
MSSSNRLAWPPRRRQLIAGLGWAAACLAWPALASSRRALPAMTEGPFYPLHRPLDDDADLRRVRGQAQAARGEWLDIAGVVVDTQGRVVDGAAIEIWQCDVYGSYRHPHGTGPRVDAGFQGFGATVSDAQGAFRFRSIRPVVYPGRAPHIHVKVLHPSFGQRVSQWFVAGEAANEQDVLFRRLGPADRAEVEMRLQAAPAGAAVRWITRRDLVVPA